HKCSGSGTGKAPLSLRAVLIIQNWFRGYRARLKARQQYALTIFQSIEYADEQDQIQLCNFFTFMLENYKHIRKEEIELSQLTESKLDMMDKQDYVDLIDVPDSYQGPRLQFPLTCADIDLLLEAFKGKQILHARYVLEVLFETKKLLKQMPNFTQIQTSPSKEVTVCGDLHGKLDDLFLIFYKNGLPSGSNPYVFNGDFVDRGRNSMEVLMILCVSFLKNKTYSISYLQIHGKKILQTLEELYTWLPIGTIIDNEILVVHGGISETTDLNLLHRLERNKMKSVLMPPKEINKDYNTDSKHSKLGVTISAHGRIKASGLSSEHLPKHEWEQVVTIFSASNYYEEDSNRGAYVKLCSGTNPRFFQYQVTDATCFQPLHQRVSTMENSAIKILRERMISRKSDLIHAFQHQDRRKSGKLPVSQWAFCMESILGLNLPWRSLSSNLVIIDQNGNVEYMSSFRNIHIEKPIKEANSALVETLYRYRSDLEIIFNAIDTDHSGLISMEEFHAMWKLFSSHYNLHIDNSQVNKIANMMDLNRDGSIDFTEFLKAFYVVHKYETMVKPEATNLA
uniref:Serine/threonine-protein phosphatase with EF-hands 1 n=1 Tax=Cebus imitator TaxID=2715852 RepID=A0A2K5PIL5_CEBIM